MQPIKQHHSRDDVIHIQEYLNVFLRRRKAFLLGFSVIFLSVVAVTFLMDPLYEATATLHIKDDKGRLSPLDELTLSTSNPIDAEIEILKSRTNAEKVVKRLRLDIRTFRERGEPAFKVLELTSDRTEGHYKIVLSGKDTFTVHDESNAVVGDGTSGVLMRGKGITLLLDELSGESGDMIRIELLPFNGVVKDIRDNTHAAEASRKTNIIRLSHVNTDPVLASNIVNTLVRVYLDQSISFKTEEARRTVDFLEQQLENVKKDLDISERNLESYKRSSGIILLDAEADELIKKLSLTEKERAGVTIQRKQAEFALQTLDEATVRKESYTPSVLKDDPLIAAMAGKMAELEVQKQTLLAEFTPSHPAVKSLQEQIQALRGRMEDTYRTSIRTYEKQEGSITHQLAAYDARLKKLPSSERELARLTRIYKVNADIYTFLLQKHEEARIAKASTISNINIVDPAIAPEEPVKPRKGRYLIFGLFVSLLMGTITAFSHEYIDNTINDAETAKRQLDLPLLAIIPFIPASAGGVEKEKHASLIALYEPTSSITEAFRSLRTSIHFSGVSKKRQVIMVTSSLPFEGKTTIIGNLAIILSQTGSRVLLLDCDLRRPSLHKLYNSNKAPGLTELLADDESMDDLVHATGVPGLDFISAGTTPPNPAELLGSGKMRSLLHVFRERYDTILIDTPPVLAVTDSLLLSGLTDMALLVIEMGRVPMKAAAHAREVLLNVGAPMAGIVLNDKAEHRLERYGYYGEKYYRYGYYGYSNYGESPPQDQAAAKRPWWRRFLRR